MRENGKWIFSLWAREWNNWEKRLIRNLRAELLILVAVFLLCVVNKSFVSGLYVRILSLPEEVRAFWGISGAVSAKDPFLGMRWALMPFHVWFAWEACYYSLRIIWREEEEGSIFFLCNQWYNRYQIGIAKYTWSVVNFIVNYLILMVGYIGLAMLGGSSGKQRLAEAGFAVKLGLKGIVVITLLISLSSCHAMLRSRRRAQAWVDGLVLGTLAVGNLYKLFGLIALWMRRAGKNYAGIVRWAGWMEKLRWFSPLGWLNPFRKFSVGETALQIAICVAVSGGAAVLGLLGYRVKRFEG